MSTTDIAFIISIAIIFAYIAVEIIINKEKES